MVTPVCNPTTGIQLCAAPPGAGPLGPLGPSGLPLLRWGENTLSSVSGTFGVCPAAGPQGTRRTLCCKGTEVPCAPVPASETRRGMGTSSASGSASLARLPHQSRNWEPRGEGVQIPRNPTGLRLRPGGSMLGWVPSRGQRGRRDLESHLLLSSSPEASAKYVLPNQGWTGRQGFVSREGSPSMREAGSPGPRVCAGRQATV